MGGKKRRVMNGPLLGVAEAAAFLGATERALRCRIARRIVPFRKLGGRIVFSRGEMESLYNELPGVSIQEAKERAEGAA